MHASIARYQYSPVIDDESSPSSTLTSRSLPVSSVCATAASRDSSPQIRRFPCVDNANALLSSDPTVPKRAATSSGSDGDGVRGSTNNCLLAQNGNMVQD